MSINTCSYVAAVSCGSFPILPFFKIVKARLFIPHLNGLNVASVRVERIVVWISFFLIRLKVKNSGTRGQKGWENESWGTTEKKAKRLRERKELEERTTEIQRQRGGGGEEREREMQCNQFVCVSTIP